MSVKLSSQKISRMLRLYFQGFPQTAIAAKLKVNQATVSFYINEFTAMAAEEGLEAAAKEYGIMDIVKELHSLGAECKKSGLTVEDAKKALKMAIVLEECGVDQDEFQDAVNTFIKLKKEGFLEAAMELNMVEEGSGKLFDEIVEEASNAQSQTQQAIKELSEVKEKTAKEKQALAATLQEKAGVEKNFKQVLQDIAGNLERLKKVEYLAIALKNAGITDKDLDWYIQRQNLLDKAGIAISVFAQILDATKVPTAADGGKGLLKKLNEYGGLNEGIVTLKQDKQSLVNEVKDLNDKAKQKGKLQVEVTNLQVKKNELEGSVASLHAEEGTTRQSLEKLKADHKYFSEQVTALTGAISEKQAIDQNLDQTIASKQKNVADLTSLEEKREVVLRELAEAEARKKVEGRRWEAYEGFLGLVKASSMAEVRKAARTLPKIVEEAEEGEYTPKFLKNVILLDLAGHELQVCRCKTCGASFNVDKPSTSGSYYCPVGGFMHTVVVDKNATATLMKAMSGPKIIAGNTITVTSTPAKKQAPGADKGNT